MELRDKMVKAKLKPDRYTFSGLIEACSKAGKVRDRLISTHKCREKAS